MNHAEIAYRSAVELRAKNRNSDDFSAFIPYVLSDEGDDTEEDEACLCHGPMNAREENQLFLGEALAPLKMPFSILSTRPAKREGATLESGPTGDGRTAERQMRGGSFDPPPRAGKRW